MHVPSSILSHAAKRDPHPSLAVIRDIVSPDFGLAMLTTMMETVCGAAARPPTLHGAHAGDACAPCCAWGACGNTHAAPCQDACDDHRAMADDCDAASSTTEEMAGSPDQGQTAWASPAASPQAADKPAAKGRKVAAKAASCKPQRMCMYEHCPSPMHSSKWRVVTATTVAGGRDWQTLFGMTLCDSCYSTYRKHGTFIRSVRTTEGWARFDHSAQTHILNKPSKKRVSPTPRPVKRSRQGTSAADPAAKRRAPSLIVDNESESLTVDLLAGRPRRERKPSAKLRDVLCGPEEEHDESSESSDYVDTPSTTPAANECWRDEAVEYESSSTDSEMNREPEEAGGEDADLPTTINNDQHELDDQFPVGLPGWFPVAPVDGDSFLVF